MILFLIIVGTFAFFVWYVIDSQKPKKTYRQTQLEIAGYDHEAMMRDAEELLKKTEVMIQSDIMGDKETHDAILNDTYQGPWPEKRGDGAYLSIYDDLRILKIAGINYCDRINRYTGQCICALLPDPKNEFDSKAIKIVAEDGNKIGFIPSHQTEFVRSLTGEQFPYRCTAQIRELEDENDGHKFYDGRIYIKRA